MQKSELKTLEESHRMDLRRREDLRLLRGRGLFLEDIKMPGTLHASLVRSPYAHARIKSIDKKVAMELPGVYAVYTGKDLIHRLKPFAPLPPIPKSVGGYSLAIDRVRYVGEPVAVVLAEEQYIANDAKYLVKIDYDILEPVMDPYVAIDDSSQRIHEELGGNIAWEKKFKFGNPTDALSKSDLILEETFKFHRFSSVPLEPFGCCAVYDDADDVLTLWTQQQAPGRALAWLAEMLDMPSNKIRLRTQDVGGGFGIKISTLTYDVLIALLALETGRPIKWVETRSENLISDVQGNERIWKVRAGFSKDGLLMGLDIKGLDVQGGYLRFPEPVGCLIWNQVVCNAYKVKDIAVDMKAILSNKAPIGANRGYGRIQYLFMLERMMDIAARKLGLDPVGIRLRNYIERESFPYTTPSGCIYDSGDYREVLLKALKISEYTRWRKVKESESSGAHLLGIGIAGFVESGGSNYAQMRLINPNSRLSGCPECASVTVDSIGSARVALSSCPAGQGHETSAALVVSKLLSIDLEKIHVVAGFDSFVNPFSGLSGTTSSRFASAQVGAIAGACEQLAKKIRAIGAHLLGSDPASVTLSRGCVSDINDPSKQVSLKEIAFTANSSPLELPGEMEPGLNSTCCYSYPEFTLPKEDRINNSSTYAFNFHVAVVEIDRSSGKLKFLRYVVVDDCGNVINEKIVEGQLHGAVGHSIGASLFEKFDYGSDGAPLNSTFIDYLAPTAADLPMVELGSVCTPSPFTPMGTKGMGEGGGTALACVANAIADAIPGARVVDSHFSPEDLLRLIREYGQ